MLICPVKRSLGRHVVLLAAQKICELGGRFRGDLFLLVFITMVSSMNGGMNGCNWLEEISKYA